MGWWSDFTGKIGADAAKAAAADTYGKQQSAIARLLGYGDELKAGYDSIGASYQPYVNSANRLAGTSDEALNNLLQNPDSVRALLSYQFDQQEGQRAVDRSAAARGMDASGRTLKDLTRFGTGLADQTYGNQLTRLLGIDQQGFSQGMQALGAQNSAYGQGLQGQYGARASAYGGDMASAGTIAQGDPWNRRSVHVPKGRGPFNSWEDAAIDALAIDGTDRVSAWSIERLCYELEKYNGFGCRAKGIHTPYLWSYSNHYTHGKYVADHVWDAAAVSGQAGAMPLLSRMMATDPSIRFGDAPPRPPDVEPAPAPVVVSTPKSSAPKPLVKSKTLWASVAAGMTTAGSAFTAALSDWRVWCAVIVLALLAYVVWERNGKPDIRGLVR